MATVLAIAGIRMFPFAYIYCIFRNLFSVDPIPRAIFIYALVMLIGYVDLVILGVEVGIISKQDHGLVLRLTNAGIIGFFLLLLFMVFYMSKERDTQIMRRYASFSKRRRNVYEVVTVVQILVTFVGLAAMLLTA